LLWHRGKSYDFVVTTLAATPRSFLLLERIVPSRRRFLVVLEFIPVLGAEARELWGAPTSRLRHLISALMWRAVTVPVLHRSMALAQCLTEWEAPRSAAELKLSEDRFCVVPWFRSSVTPVQARAPESARTGVLASGRAACDWATVFAASRGQDWPLTVVCSSRDLELVRSLNDDGKARILCEIPRDAHAQEIKEASVYLLALREAEVSSGQVRLSDAWEVGTPVVAAEVKGLEGYLSAGRNALTFAPGDPRAARQAVNELLGDASLRETMARQATEDAANWTRADYLGALAERLRSAQSAGR
jgi:hypothetical protein